MIFTTLKISLILKSAHISDQESTVKKRPRNKIAAGPGQLTVNYFYTDNIQRFYKSFTHLKPRCSIPLSSVLFILLDTL